MLHPFISFLLIISTIFCSSSAFASQSRPKLLLVLVIDQFRADYLRRFEDQFLPALLPKKGASAQVGGFRYLMTHSAYYPQGQYNTLQNITAPGHATILTGAYPYQSGIPLNNWYDAREQKETYCTEDATSAIIGSQGKTQGLGMSPKNLKATTLGDELKNEGLASRVVSVALKDRAAILLGGHRADLALWYDISRNEWVSSQHYLSEPSLPSWVIQLNREMKSHQNETTKWQLLSHGTGPTDQNTSSAEIQKIFTGIKKNNPASIPTPYGVELTVQAAEKALDAYSLGNGKSTDLLAVSISSHDMVGHRYGPNSRFMEEMTLAEDRAISRLLNTVQKKVPGGLSSVVVVLTADHGVAPSPDWTLKNKIKSGIIDMEELAKSISLQLNQKYGKPKQGEWIISTSTLNLYLNRPEILAQKMDLLTIESEVKEILLKYPEVAFVVGSTDFSARKLPLGIYELQATHAFHPGRSGDLIVYPRPYTIAANRDVKPGFTAHVTGYSYDRTVPILLSGFHIRPGVYATPAEVVDIAPTLSFLSGVLPPSLSEGKVLSEALDTRNLVH